MQIYYAGTYGRERRIITDRIPDILLDPNTPNFYVAGGAVMAAFSGVPSADLDLFTEFAVTTEALIEHIRASGCTPALVTPAATTFRIDGCLVQCIQKVHGEPHDVLELFDFTIISAAYRPADRAFILHDDFLRDLAARRLIYIPGDYPISSLWRIKKYLARGFKIPATELIRLALTIHGIKLETYEDLRAQLEGIDMLFLKTLIDSVAAKGNATCDVREAINYIDEVLNDKLCDVEEGGGDLV